MAPSGTGSGWTFPPQTRHRHHADVLARGELRSCATRPQFRQRPPRVLQVRSRPAIATADLKNLQPATSPIMSRISFCSEISVVRPRAVPRQSFQARGIELRRRRDVHFAIRALAAGRGEAASPRRRRQVAGRSPKVRSGGHTRRDTEPAENRHERKRSVAGDCRHCRGKAGKPGKPWTFR